MLFLGTGPGSCPHQEQISVQSQMDHCSRGVSRRVLPMGMYVQMYITSVYFKQHLLGSTSSFLNYNSFGFFNSKFDHSSYSKNLQQKSDILHIISGQIWGQKNQTNLACNKLSCDARGCGICCRSLWIIYWVSWEGTTLRQLVWLIWRVDIPMFLICLIYAWILSTNTHYWWMALVSTKCIYLMCDVSVVLCNLKKVIFICLLYYRFGSIKGDNASG